MLYECQYSPSPPTIDQSVIQTNKGGMCSDVIGWTIISSMSKLAAVTENVFMHVLQN